MISQNFLDRLHELPPNLSAHLRLTVIALASGVLISVPLAVWLVRRPRLRYPVLTAAGVIQTIPSLALLALMVPLLAVVAYAMGYLQLSMTGQEVPEAAREVRLFSVFGFWPAIIALSLYSILPILRNSVTGILGVDPPLIEAARGVGMTDRQILWKVQLPLAAPVIIAGIRTATVWVVGIATLATPVGQRCLGNYIFTGLQTQNWMMVMFGVVSAAMLAILLDMLIGGVQQAVEQRRRLLGVASLTALLFVSIAGLISPTIARMIAAPEHMAVIDDTISPDAMEDRPVVHIGSKTFTEQYVLAALIDQRLRSRGFETRRTDSLGSIVIFDALAQGELDVYVDYTGTIWANTMNREDAPLPWKVYALMSGWLAETYGIRTLGELGFENAYALTMRAEHAESLGIRSISDLAAHAPEMKIGGDYEFFGRPEWSRLRSVYGLQFADRISYDSTLMYEALAGGEVDVISAFSTDGRIAGFDLIVLDDDRFVIPPYDAVILLGPRVADRADVADALRALIGAIDADLMRQANHKVDRGENRYTIEQAAEWLWQSVLDREAEAVNDSDD